MIYQYLLLILFVNVVLSLRCNTISSSNCIYNSTCSYSTKECDVSSNIRGGIYCATIIQNHDEIIVGSMGCMYDQETSKTCRNQTECVLKFTQKEKTFLHCCCDKDYCNFNFVLTNSSDINPTPDLRPDRQNHCKGFLCKQIVIIVLCSIFGFISILIVICIINRKKLFKSLNKLCGKLSRTSSTDEKPGIEENIENGKLLTSKEEINFNDLIIGNIVKRGRFSIIHQGMFNKKKVAIKVLSDNNQTGEHKNLFQHEKQIYSLPSMEHDNILKYYGYSIRNDYYYLVTEFSEYGSLRDVLRSRSLKDEHELISICKQISSGLEHLHSDFRNRNNVEGETRPPIAHRDLKSDNILYVNENKLVICDFAMSVQLDQHQNSPNEQQQIGTPRYMSPEILAGTIGCETNALLKCDVYALGIIFWEVLSRCPILQESNETYEMPFEKQLIEHGLSPQVHGMSQIINLNSPMNRPLIRSSWRKTNKKSVNEILSTMEQCWDQNPEGRINAALVAFRMRQLLKE